VSTLDVYTVSFKATGTNAKSGQQDFC